MKSAALVIALVPDVTTRGRVKTAMQSCSAEYVDIFSVAGFPQAVGAFLLSPNEDLHLELEGILREEEALSRQDDLLCLYFNEGMPYTSLRGTPMFLMYLIYKGEMSRQELAPQILAMDNMAIVDSSWFPQEERKDLLPGEICLALGFVGTPTKLAAFILRLRTLLGNHFLLGYGVRELPR